MAYVGAVQAEVVEPGGHRAVLSGLPLAQFLLLLRPPPVLLLIRPGVRRRRDVGLFQAQCLDDLADMPWVSLNPEARRGPRYGPVQDLHTLGHVRIPAHDLRLGLVDLGDVVHELLNFFPRSFQRDVITVHGRAQTPPRSVVEAGAGLALSEPELTHCRSEFLAPVLCGVPGAVQACP